MTTTAAELCGQASHLTVTTAGAAATTLTACRSTPLPTATTSAATGQALGGPSQASGDPTLVNQIADLNFYLRRVSLGGNGDISQIESYGGGPDYEMFLNAVTSVGTHFGWTEGQLIRTVEMKLKDKAREYYGALLPRERPTNMVEMRSWFRRVFERKLTISAGKRELERCIRNPGEPLGEFAQRLKVVANKMFPANALTSGERLYHRNLLLVNQFIEGLEGRLANEVLRAGEFYDLNDCLVVAEQCEEIVSRMIPETRYDIRMSSIRRIDAEKQEERRGQTSRHSPRQEEFHERRQREDYQVEQQERPGTSSTYRNYHGRNARTRQGRGNGTRFPRLTIAERYPYMENRCIRCGEENHLAMQCSARTRKLFCYHCGKQGEICSLNSPRHAIQRPR